MNKQACVNGKVSRPAWGHCGLVPTYSCANSYGALTQRTPSRANQDEDPFVAPADGRHEILNYLPLCKELIYINVQKLQQLKKLS